MDYSEITIKEKNLDFWFEYVQSRPCDGVSIQGVLPIQAPLLLRTERFFYRLSAKTTMPWTCTVEKSGISTT